MDFNDYLVIGMAVCVVVLLGIFIYKSVKPSEKAVSSNIPANKKGGNIDFFNKTTGNIAKTTKLVVENENKTYFLIDLGNGKLIVMEESNYIPDGSAQSFINDMTVDSELYETDGDYEPEARNEVLTESAIADISNDADEDEFVPEMDLGSGDGDMEEMSRKEAEDLREYANKAADDYMKAHNQGKLFDTSDDSPENQDEEE